MRRLPDPPGPTQRTVSPPRVATLATFRLLFFNATAATEIYTLSLHDALPISGRAAGYRRARTDSGTPGVGATARSGRRQDRKSTRLNSSHPSISYAVFCLKKKTTNLNAGSSTRAAISNPNFAPRPKIDIILG